MYTPPSRSAEAKEERDYTYERWGEGTDGASSSDHMDMVDTMWLTFRAKWVKLTSLIILIEKGSYYAH